MDITVSFAKIKVGDKWYNYDVIIKPDGEVIKRLKHLSKPLSDKYGHTPLSVTEIIETLKILGDIDFLVIGNGLSSRMKVEDGVLRILKEKGVKTIVEPTRESIKTFQEMLKTGKKAALIVHTTC